MTPTNPTPEQDGPPEVDPKTPDWQDGYETAEAEYTGGWGAELQRLYREERLRSDELLFRAEQAEKERDEARAEAAHWHGAFLGTSTRVTQLQEALRELHDSICAYPLPDDSLREAEGTKAELDRVDAALDVARAALHDSKGEGDG